VLILLSGCFPYRQQYRPKVAGTVTDLEGAAVEATVVSCSMSKWSGLSAGCQRKSIETTDAGGAFAFKELKEWDWCCLGEAPMPFTIIVACAPGVGVGVTRVGGEGQGGSVEVKVSSKPVSASNADAVFAQDVCAEGP
jgi:hypothetical protein